MTEQKPPARPEAKPDPDTKPDQKSATPAKAGDGTAASSPAEQKLSPSAAKAQKADAEQAAEAAKSARDEQLQAAKDRHEGAKDLADRDFEEEKVRVEAQFAAHEDAEKRAKSGDLGPAGESTNPDVHQALAEREIARTNRDAAGEALADRRLALLGVK